MSNKWAISRYPEEPSILYRRDGQGKLEYVKELDLPAYLNSSFFPYDENTFFVSAYGNLLIELKIADGGETFIRWIPLGFQPYVGYSACLPMLYDFARMGDNLIVACCGACVDSSPPDDFVPDKVDVPITWEYPQGAIVFVNRVQDATPEIIMPNVNLDRFEDGSFAFESAQDIAVYREFIAVIQFDELRIWKRVGDAMEIVQRMNKQGHFSLAVSGHWLLACNYNGLDVYDLSQLKSPVDCWEFY